MSEFLREDQNASKKNKRKTKEKQKKNQFGAPAQSIEAAAPGKLYDKPYGRGPFAIELLGPGSDDVVLDVGCFDGSLEYHYLRGRVRSFHGIDLNTEAIDRARKWCEPPHSFQVAPSEKIPFADNAFDKALCLDVFEHVFDERQTARELFRVLKPGGTLVLSVPHDFLNFLDPDELTRGARNIVRRYIRKKPLLDHPKHRHYNEAQLRDFFDGFTFEVVHRCGTPVFWILAMAYTAFGIPQSIVRRLAAITGPLENWDYRTALPTGFNIMVKLRKPAAERCR